MTAASANHDLVPGWLLLAIYVAGFVITARIVFITSYSEGDDEQRFAAAALGLFWPFVLAALGAYGLARLPTLGAKTRRDRQIQAQSAERERRKAAARIAELEAEDERWRKGGQP
jgi:hypothetical protein